MGVKESSPQMLPAEPAPTPGIACFWCLTKAMFVVYLQHTSDDAYGTARS